MNIFIEKNKAAPLTAAPVPAGPVRWIGLALALVTVVIYLPVRSFDFVEFDDPGYVADNPVVKAGLTWAGLKWAFAGWHESNWHPLTWLSHELDCQLFGLNPGAHHLVNVLFHAANAVLLFYLWLRLTGRCWPSALVAALFAWHPLRVESVAWIAERKDVLSTFFGLLCLLAYVQYARARTTLPNGPAAGFKAWWLALLFLALGCLCKGMLVTLPCVMLLLDFWPLRRLDPDARPLAAGGRLVLEKIPFFLLAAASAVVTYLAERQESVIPLQAIPLGFRLENSLAAYAGYLGKIFWPSRLCVYYPMHPQFTVVALAVPAVVLLAVSAAAWHWRRRHPPLLMGWLWFLGMLVPVIGFVQVGDKALADRYTYLPSVGLFVGLVFGLAEIMPRRLARATAAAAIPVLAACVIITEHQLSFWHNTETLFQHAAAVTENNGRAHLMLFVEYDRQGRAAESREQYRQAMDCFARVEAPFRDGQNHPVSAELQLWFGHLKEARGDTDDALGYYRDAVQSDPDFVEARLELGDLLARLGRPAGALTNYQAVVRLRPDLVAAHEDLGVQLTKLGRYDEALREYQAAMRLDPLNPQPLYLSGRLWLGRGQSRDAVAAFQQALQLNPNDGPSLVYLAQVLASDESPEIRDGAAAVKLAERANQMTGGTQPLILGTLAMACAEAGRFDDARKAARTALDLAPATAPNLVTGLQAQLQCYEAGRPFRQRFATPPL